VKVTEKHVRDIELASSVLDLATSRDGRTLFAACLDGTVREVDAESGASTVLTTHSSFASGVALIHDEIVVSAGYDGVLQWHDRGGRKLREVAAHSFWSWQLAASVDGRFVASSTGQYLCGSYEYAPAAEREPSVKLFSALGGDLLHAFSHRPPVLSVAFSPDGERVAAGNLMGDVVVWDTASGAELARWNTPSFTGWGVIKGHYYTGGIFSLAPTPNGDEWLLAGMGSTTDPAAGNGRQLWQRFAWKESPARRVDETHDGESGQGLMETLAFDPSGRVFAIGGRTAKGNWNVAFFAAASGAIAGSFASGHRVTRLVWRPEGDRVFLAGAVGQGKRLDDGSYAPFGRIQIRDVTLDA